jgi:hypothetical protein
MRARVGDGCRERERGEELERGELKRGERGHALSLHVTSSSRSEYRPNPFA